MACAAGGRTSRDVDDRPAILALVAYFAAPFGVMSEMRLVTLDEAAMWHEMSPNYVVLVDPESEIAFANWERRQRSLRIWR